MYTDGVIVVTLLFLFSVGLSETKDDVEQVVHRERRQLLFPNSTLLQFNAGIGTPTPHKLINLNYAFQANFQLPWNRTQIPIDILDANSGYDGFSKKRDVGELTERVRRDVTDVEEKNKKDGDYESDAKLYHFYKYVEDLLNSGGHNGTSCVLQALCQIGAQPLHSIEDDDLLHELASFVLNPTNDIDNEIDEKNEIYPYVDAYTKGQNHQDCYGIYSCSVHTSLLDMFTVLDKVS